MRALLRKPFYLAAPVLGAVYAFAVLDYFSSYSYLLLLGLIAVCAGALLAFTDYTTVYKLLFLLIPVSLETVIGNGDNKILLPSEPLMIILAIAFGIMLIFRTDIDRSFLKHPVSLCILVYLGIMMLTCLSSSMPVVSLKYLLITTAYIFIFYFLAQDFLRKREGNSRAVFYLYGAGLLILVFRAFYYHSTVGFSHMAAGIVVRPYFVDHTIYSACLGMLFPAFIAFGLKGRVFGISRSACYTCLIIAFILAFAIFVSYSRAAWISVGAALLFFIVLRFRVRPAYFASAVFIAGAIVWLYRDPLIQSLKSNKHSSTEGVSDITDQTLSVGNISNDASNAERLNRWSCALRMFRDKPVTGFGPGTFQFEYLGYQRADEMTRISVTTPYNNGYGRGGSAHSEYLLALSEMGVAGFISFSLIIIPVIGCGMRAYYRSADEKTKLLTALALLGFFTYAVHALFNNFLNNNKPASLFWVLAAVIVLMDLKSRNALRQMPVSQSEKN